MELTVAADVVVDVASKDDLAEHHQRLERILEKARPHGRYYMVSGSGTTTSGFTGSGPIAVSFTPQSPPAGRMWFVQWVAVWVGQNVSVTSVANLFATLMVGRCPTGPGAPIAAAIPGGVNNSDVVNPGQNVPINVDVPDLTVVKSQTQLYVALGGSGLAASTVYNMNAGVVDVPDTDEAYFW